MTKVKMWEVEIGYNTECQTVVAKDIIEAVKKAMPLAAKYGEPITKAELIAEED